MSTTKKKNPKKKITPKAKAPKAKKKVAAAKRVRTVAVITGVKAGDPNKLAPQPCTMANIAYELGETSRAEFLTACEKSIKTDQPVGRLFSFHKPELIKGGYIKFRKVPRDKWLQKPDQPAATLAAAPAPVEPAAPVVAAPAAEVAAAPEAAPVPAGV